MPHPAQFFLCRPRSVSPRASVLLQVVGATVGRLIGEVLAVHLSESYGVVPSTFALVGAAAMSCGATQTISAAVVSVFGAADAMLLLIGDLGLGARAGEQLLELAQKQKITNTVVLISDSQTRLEC